MAAVGGAVSGPSVETTAAATVVVAPRVRGRAGWAVGPSAHATSSLASGARAARRPLQAHVAVSVLPLLAGVKSAARRQAFRVQVAIATYRLHPVARIEVGRPAGVGRRSVLFGAAGDVAEGSAPASVAATARVAPPIPLVLVLTGSAATTLPAVWVTTLSHFFYSFGLQLGLL